MMNVHKHTNAVPDTIIEISFNYTCAVRLIKRLKYGKIARL